MKVALAVVLYAHALTHLSIAHKLVLDIEIDIDQDLDSLQTRSNHLFYASRVSILIRQAIPLQTESQSPISLALSLSLSLSLFEAVRSSRTSSCLMA